MVFWSSLASPIGFVCEEMKSACDAYLASMIGSEDDALILMDYGLEETASLLVASCLQFICSSDTMERLRGAGHASFQLNLIRDVAGHVYGGELDIRHDSDVVGECATEMWQRAFAVLHLGRVKFERKANEDAQNCFEAAVERRVKFIQ
ncbi:hypothetical protein RJ641_008846 [Dillenia turbinata]|uniref:Uncharacterized protein n=1 Tax=Dillenia turbinata TaxID=194707 RepID=A0AAN8VD73_9MAGN